MVYMENFIKMDDLGVPLFSETSIYISFQRDMIEIKSSVGKHNCRMYSLFIVSHIVISPSIGPIVMSKTSWANNLLSLHLCRTFTEMTTNQPFQCWKFMSHLTTSRCFSHVFPPKSSASKSSLFDHQGVLPSLPTIGSPWARLPASADPPEGGPLGEKSTKPCVVFKEKKNPLWIPVKLWLFHDGILILIHYNSFTTG